MSDMSPADLQALAATDYRAALAIATFSLAESISSLNESVSSLNDSVSSLAFAVRVVTVGTIATGIAGAVIICMRCGRGTRLSA